MTPNRSGCLLERAEAAFERGDYYVARTILRRIIAAAGAADAQSARALESRMGGDRRALAVGVLALGLIVVISAIYVL